MAKQSRVHTHLGCDDVFISISAGKERETCDDDLKCAEAQRNIKITATRVICDIKLVR